jgi:hypothetical protein
MSVRSGVLLALVIDVGWVASDPCAIMTSGFRWPQADYAVWSCRISCRTLRDHNKNCY